MDTDLGGGEPQWSAPLMLHLKDEQTEARKMQDSFSGRAGPRCQVADFQTVSEGSPDPLKIITAALIASAPVVSASARQELLISPPQSRVAGLSEPCLLLHAAVYTIGAKCGAEAPFCLNPINRSAQI